MSNSSNQNLKRNISEVYLSYLVVAVVVVVVVVKIIIIIIIIIITSETGKQHYNY